MMEIENKKNGIAGMISQLMPLFARKFMRPLELHTRNITSPLHMHALIILSEKEVFTMTELSNEMYISKQQMTPIIDKLVDNGFVQREHDNIDRRSIKISLTSAGLRFLDDTNKDTATMIKSKIEKLDTDDLNSLHLALDDLQRIISKIPT